MALSTPPLLSAFQHPPPVMSACVWWPRGARASGRAVTGAPKDRRRLLGLIKPLSQEEHRVRLAEHRIINFLVYVQAQITSSGSRFNEASYSFTQKVTVYRHVPINENHNHCLITCPLPRHKFYNLQHFLQKTMSATHFNVKNVNLIPY